VSAVALELDLRMDEDEVSFRDIAVTAAIELDLDTLAGGGAVTVELDLDTGWGRCSEEAVEAGNERTVATEFVREMEGKARDSRLLEVEGALDNGEGN